MPGGCIVLVAALLTLALMVGSASGSTDDDGTSTASLAQRIMAGQTPLGDDLAEQLGLEMQPGFTGGCSHYIEVEASGAGYCLEDVPGSTAERSVVAAALQGRIVQAEEWQILQEQDRET